MSRDSVLRLVARMERLADAMHTADQSQLQSLQGQVLGTYAAIREDLRAMGINPDNPLLAEMAEGVSGRRDSIQLTHMVSAYVRGLLER